ncbi:MAG: transcriptional regulator [Segetibacter sp.]|nr:transcriptional regulator [Segetibacter sp.]
MATLTKIEQSVIDKVKALRIKNNFSQKDLSIEMGFSEGFVGHVENPKRRDKYNLNHINTLAKIFKCSPKDFIPERALQ